MRAFPGAHTSHAALFLLLLGCASPPLSLASDVARLSIDGRVVFVPAPQGMSDAGELTVNVSWGRAAGTVSRVDSPGSS
jgi:hypothetical protein